MPLTTFHQFDNAYQARWTVVRLWYEGWHQQSIAGYLQLSRKHVWEILAAFRRDGFSGLEDQRTRSPTHPANQLTLPFLSEVLAVQRDYPRAGRFRVRGLVAQRMGKEPPSERTVGRAMALNREHHGAPPAWMTDRPDPAEPDGVVKDMPYTLTHRHRYWFIDIRYLVRLGELGERSEQEDAARESQETPERADQQGKPAEHWVYSLCIIEGYSRKILAGMASPSQDVVAVLQLLSAALSTYGRPEGIVSDNGSVFTSDAYEGLLAALGIEICHIEKGKPWQNLIEAQFKIELRLADAAFEQAATLAEIQERHAAFVETFNTTVHWAHRERADGLRTPEETLGWVRGRELPHILQLLQALRQLQDVRTVNRAGYVSVQRFYLYAEQGLARQRVSVWLYDGRLSIAYQQAVLAQYSYRAERRGKRLREVDPQPQLYRTTYVSPQLELWELDDAQWRKVFERSPYQRHRAPAPAIPIQQLALPMVGLAIALLLAIPG